MGKEKRTGMSLGTDEEPQAATEEVKSEGRGEAVPEEFNWFTYCRDSSEAAIRTKVAEEFGRLAKRPGLERYVLLGMLDGEGSISTFEADRIFEALVSSNPDSGKDVLLVIRSRGGSIEPAYQISKICKRYAKGKFVVAVPRHAKSAATLISIGADEIHMGPLSELGPIDPQLGGLPALGVAQALDRIASLVERYPKSADMFARYLKMAVTVEQIGYSERVSESAVQYAERLLRTKPHLVDRAAEIAKELVYEYKDHGFVIDQEEAEQHLGAEWIKRDTPEQAFAEEVYKIFEDVDLFLRIMRKRRLVVTGNLEGEPMIFKVE